MQEEALIIQAPVISFLRSEETEWIRFVNLKTWGEQEDQTEYVEAVDHMALLLHQFLEGRSKDLEERRDIFAEIAEAISRQLRAIDQKVVPNPQFSPDADWNDRTQIIATKPFLFANVEGIAGMYSSLARFLSSPFIRRLGCCQACNALYLAPDDEDYEHCANTDRQEK